MGKMRLLLTVYAFIFFFTYLPESPNLEKKNIYSNKFFHNFRLSESSFTCPKLRASGLVQRLFLTTFTGYIIKIVIKQINDSKFYCL